jgi:hypothetical protein
MQLISILTIFIFLIVPSFTYALSHDEAKAACLNLDDKIFVGETDWDTNYYNYEDGNNAKFYNCHVAKFEKFKGTENIYFSTYELNEKNGRKTCSDYSISHPYPYNNRAVVIFEEVNNEMKPILARYTMSCGTVWYPEPELAQNEYGKFIRVNINIFGTGSGNIDKILFFNGSNWLEIDNNSWINEIKLPSGVEIRKGIKIDLQNLKIVSGLWQDGDPNCCGSAGEILINLKLEGLKLKVKDYKISANKYNP